MAQSESKMEQNKPAAQAEGADPPRCKSTNRQKLPFQQISYNSGTSSAILIPFEIYILLKFPNIVYSMSGSTISNH